MNSIFKMINKKSLSRKNVEYAISMAYKQGVVAALLASQGEFVPSEETGITTCSTASVKHDVIDDDPVSVLVNTQAALVHVSHGRVDYAINELR